MSATIDADRFAHFFCDPASGAPAIVLDVGRQPFEVCRSTRTRSAPRCRPSSRCGRSTRPRPARAAAGAARLDPAMYDAACYLLRALSDGTRAEALPDKLPEAELEAMKQPHRAALGAVLVFVPGQAEIYEMVHAIGAGGAGVDARALQIVPLHGLLDDDTQRDAFAPAPPGVRKVVISTNIAESSVTVPDVRFVIDFGFEKLPWFSPTTNTQALLLKLCSRASAAQRAGRAGRVAPGVAFRLYTQSLFTDHMPPYVPPEMCAPR